MDFCLLKHGCQKMFRTGIYQLGTTADRNTVSRLTYNMSIDMQYVDQHSHYVCGLTYCMSTDILYASRYINACLSTDIIHFSPFITLIVITRFGYNTARSCLPNDNVPIVSL